MYECEGDSLTYTGDNLNVLRFGNSACGDFSGNAAPTSLRRMFNLQVWISPTATSPHSLTLHNPKNSLTILELLDSISKITQNKI
nr:hypothetical protein [uncultured Helicobacter sp.]